MSVDRKHEQAVPSPNPYAPTIGTEERDALSVSTPAKSAQPRWSKWLWLTPLMLCTVFCCFLVAAVIWEITTMPEDAYGIHRQMFRDNYIRSGVIGLSMGIAGVIAAWCVHRGLRYSKAFALCVFVAMAVMFIL